MDSVRMIGDSPPFRNLLRIAEKIAKSSAVTTLITGENGTGKELIARYIHEHSANADQPFIDINCGAIPESLLESELFGHERGSFTGAISEKKGLFELASGGTVFLDEIANTSLNFQSKLLKVVETKRFRRVGGLHEISVSTRIVAATNIDLQEAVKSGRFREDLYYRLNIGQISVPPLRERGDDVLLLANYFLEACNHDFGRDIKGIRPEALQMIRNYVWPGNARQLRNTIERAVLIESEEWVEVNDLNLEPLSISSPVAEHDQTHDHSPQRRSSEISYQLPKDVNHFRFPTKGIPLEELERGIIRSALDKAGGNLSHAARLLKITRGKLRYRLEKLGIEI